jgi:hypothetical protein
LLGAIAGAALGAYVQKVWSAESTDADDFGRRLANLEAEIEELERLQRERKRKRSVEPAARPSQPQEPSQPQQAEQPAQARQASRPRSLQRQESQGQPRQSQPFPEVRGKPPEQQYLVLSADRNFTLSRVDYVSSQGTMGMVISEDVKKSGRRIEVPINEKKVSRIWYLVQRVNAEPAPFQFRCHLRVDGVETQSVVPAVIQQKFMRTDLGRTIFRNVTLAPGVAELPAI